jgi:hypothetical protein
MQINFAYTFVHIVWDFLNGVLVSMGFGKQGFNTVII